MAKGQWNFDEIKIVYFRDRSPAFLAFKAGELDFWRESSAKYWATGYDFDAVKRGLVREHKLPVAEVAPMQAFAFNTRRPQFQDPRVRRAFNLAFNFEWANANLFYGEYQRVDSYFDNSELMASGLPQGRELEILNEVRAEVPPEVFTKEWKNPVNNAPDDARKHLAMAAKLLAEAGYQQKNGVLTNAAGVQLTAEFLLSQPDFERVVLPYVKELEKLGIKAACAPSTRQQYQRRRDTFDFDIIVQTFRAVAVSRQRAARLLGLRRRRQGRQPQRHRHQEPGDRQADRQDHPGQGSARSRRRHAGAGPGAAVGTTTSCRSGTRPSSAWPCGTCTGGRTSCRRADPSFLRVWWWDDAAAKRLADARG